MKKRIGSYLICSLVLAAASGCAGGSLGALNQSIAVTTNTITPIGLAAKVTNASLTYQVVASPAHGTLTGTAPAVVYTPTTGYAGSDSFTFTVSDGTLTSSAATVSLNVRAPTIVTYPTGASGVVTCGVPVFDGTNVWTGHNQFTMSKLTTSGAVLFTDASYTNSGSGVTANLFDGTYMWGIFSGDQLSRINPSDGSVHDSLSLTVNNSVVSDGTSVWTTTASSLVQISKTTNTVLNTYPVGGGTGNQGVAYDGTNFWVTNSTANTVVKVSKTGVVGTPITIAPPSWEPPVFDGTNLWLVSQANNLVTEISPTQNAVLGTYDMTSVGTGVGALNFDGQYLWLATGNGYGVAKLSTAGQIMGNYTLGGDYICGAAWDGNNLWVTNWGATAYLTKFTP